MKNKLILILLFITASIYSQPFVANPDMWITNGYVYTVASNNNYTYVAGDFSYVGLATGTGIKIKSNSIEINRNDFPIVNGQIQCSTIDGEGGWFIGGRFSKVGNLQMSSLAHINSDGIVSSSFNPQIGYSGTYVTSVVLDGEYLYIGGTFNTVNGIFRNGLAKINKNTGALDLLWDPNASYGSGSTEIKSILIKDSSLYVAGAFSIIGGKARKNLAKLDKNGGTADSLWKPISEYQVNVITSKDNNIFTAADFQPYLCKFDSYCGAADSLWNPPFTSGIKTLIVSDSCIFAGGEFFTSYQGKTFEGLIKLDINTGIPDTNWNPGASYARGYIKSLAIKDNYIYAGGSNTLIGVRAQEYIAKLDIITGLPDTNWILKVNGTVNTITIHENAVFLGGLFSSAGGYVKNNIYRIRNSDLRVDSSWNIAMDGYNCSILKILVIGDYVYLAGHFDKINNQTKKNLAKLDNSGVLDLSFSPNPNYSVNNLVNYGNYIYVGGYFTSIGGLTRNSLAKINLDGQVDESWIPPSLNGNISSIAPYGSSIYVGGDFSSGDIKYAVKLDTIYGNINSLWKPTISFPSSVNSIAVDDNSVYISGGTIFKVDNVTGVRDLAWNPGSGGIDKLCLADDAVFVGGNFTFIGGQPRISAAKLNKTNGDAYPWNPNILGNPSIDIFDIVSNGDDLIYAGKFFTVNGNIQTNIALFTNRILGTDEIVNLQPRAYNLKQNYPNPFNPSTTITFNIPKEEKVSMKVYNLLGQEVSTLMNEYKSAGVYTLNFDAKNLSSGIYFYRIEAGSFIETKKMVVLR